MEGGGKVQQFDPSPPRHSLEHCDIFCQFSNLPEEILQNITLFYEDTI